jgi:hypothetical protein
MRPIVIVRIRLPLCESGLRCHEQRAESEPPRSRWVAGKAPKSLESKKVATKASKSLEVLRIIGVVFLGENITAGRRVVGFFSKQREAHKTRVSSDFVELVASFSRKSYFDRLVAIGLGQWRAGNRDSGAVRV